MRRAGPDDIPGITAFLRQRIETAMFPLSNLGAHGLGTAHPHSMRFWLQGDPITGVLGLTGGGMAMPQLLQGAEGVRAALAGEVLTGIVGEAGDVAALRRDSGLSAAPTRLDETEQLMSLTLADMAMPPCEGCTLRPLDHGLAEIIIGWRALAQVESLGADPATAQEAAARDVAGWLLAGNHRVLCQDDQPVALTGFNARLPDIVQVGAVFTPAALRGRGHARRAVALHLAEVRAQGARRAVLFTDSDAALRAYRALGFAQVGQYGLTLFASPQTVPHG